LELSKTRCPMCGGPVFRPGFLFCPWCGADLAYIDLPVCSSKGEEQTMRVRLSHPEAVSNCGPYDPASRHCPACEAPLLSPSFRYCMGCGHGLLENVLNTWADLEGAIRDLEDEHIRLDLLRGEAARYRAWPPSP